MRFVHAERLAQLKGDPRAVVALGATKVVANVLPSYAENVHRAHCWLGVRIALLPGDEVVYRWSEGPARY
jgi:hypothetical protein